MDLPPEAGRQHLSRPFLKPTFESDTLIVPADEVLPGTPIAATSVDGVFADASVSRALRNLDFINTGGPDPYILLQIFSPKLVVSKYIWTNGIGFQGGPNCALCLTTSGFIAASGQYLYTAENTAAGAPSTLNGAGAPGNPTEANKVAGVWQLGVMN
ncbi:hypothetical protein B0H17DRAFT_1141524 [Mycena rosella]|uniref:Uncharacterized protein n=1 Tax=Mycena rosella TaxID=1033263 RepID=A0AAD7CZP0_MYCRO|nr:hypothetical protein B0H17DRAFT_1141524 [Mycena rosella]